MLAYHSIIRVPPVLTEAKGQITEELIRDSMHHVVLEMDAS